VEFGAAPILSRSDILIWTHELNSELDQRSISTSIPGCPIQSASFQTLDVSTPRRLGDYPSLSASGDLEAKPSRGKNKGMI
jgi:hypothetical protein